MTAPITSPWCSIGTQIANFVSRPAPGPLLISCRLGSSGMTVVRGCAYCLANTDPLSGRRLRSWTMSASVTQLPSSCTRAAGVAATAAGWERCIGAGFSGPDPLAVGALGRDGRRPLSLLRAELAMATDILRHNPGAVYSAQAHRTHARRSARLHSPGGG